MHVDSQYGPVAPELGWVPAPRYLLRRAGILRMVRGGFPGRLLEIGPGAGALLCEFARMGHEAEGLEQSEPARDVARRLIEAARLDVPIHDSPADWVARYDTVCAFDVLEHIEDDAGALARWASWLRADGSMLLSVPAHARLWSAGDEWAGHFRRYDRPGFIALLRGAGLVIERFECYGFPLTNLSERIGARAYARAMRSDRRSNNDRSGIDRVAHANLFGFLRSWPGRGAIGAADLVQRAFLRSDLGTGYLVRLRKP